MSELLEALRAATREQHAQLDRNVLGLNSVERYVTFLRGSLVALSPLERSLAPWASPERVALIRADLQDLSSNSNPDVDDRSPAIASEARAWGARYVIEGSALGGVVLARGVQRDLGDSVPVRYLTIHGAELGAHWRGFTTELNAWSIIATPAEKSAACDTANAVFAWYREAFAAVGALASNE